MSENARGRVDVALRCRPDYTRPERDALVQGFVLEYGSECLEFWATDPKDFFWRIALKKYDYHRVYEDFLTVSKGRGKVSKLIKPAFKFAEANQQPVYINGVICSLFQEIEVKEVEDAITTGGQSPEQSLPAGNL